MNIEAELETIIRTLYARGDRIGTHIVAAELFNLMHKIEDERNKNTKGEYCDAGMNI